jgi:hypothetical protein
VKRIRAATDRSTLDLLLVALGAAAGVAVGYVVGGSIGRMTAHRVKRALKRRRRRRGALRPGDWTDDDTETLEARAVTPCAATRCWRGAPSGCACWRPASWSSRGAWSPPPSGSAPASWCAASRT